MKNTFTGLGFTVRLLGGLYLLLSSVSSCKSPGDTASLPATDLSPAGNTRVATTFAAYQKKEGGCHARGEGRRVMVTGFGLFAGVSYNISGAVVSSFADAAFTPEKIDPTQVPGVHGTPASGILSDDEHGGRVINRAMEIGGAPVDICFLTLDTLWDLAAAIIVYEADRFKPDMILMTGRGGYGADFEGGAYNYAAPEPGFNSDGSVAREVTPVVAAQARARVSPIIPGAEWKLAMSWDGPRLYGRVAPMIRALGFTPELHTDARDDNTYICNNVSFVVIAAARHEPIILAGGEIRMTTGWGAGAKVGFFHFPTGATAQADAVASWIQVLAAMIDAEISGA